VKAALLLVVIAFSGCTSVTQQVLPKKLANTYAMTALLALKAIEEDTFVRVPPSRLTSRFTQDKIDAVDVLGVADQERNIAEALNQVYAVKLSLNWERYSVFGDDGRPFGGTIGVFEKKIDMCFSDFDASLRARGDSGGW
jgi:hypothetical protein